MSFGWSGVFRTGQWSVLRSYVLNQRKDVAARVAYLENQIERIGQITVLYDRVDGVVTEQRKGIYVGPVGSSLHKLVCAYCASGGNPLDISLFLRPQDAYLVRADDQEVSQFPYGGVAYPLNQDPESNVSNGGFLPVNQYMPARTVGRNQMSLERQDLEGAITLLKRPFRQTIQYQRNDPEYRIVRLCDTREQLEGELRDILVQAVGGTQSVFPELDEDRFNPENLVVSLVGQIDDLIWERDPTGRVTTKRNDQNRILYPNIVSDKPEEEGTAL